jgi:hypothetical protein
MTAIPRIAASALAASLALGVAVPASAAAAYAPGQLRAQIAQLDRDIERAEARRIISNREAVQLDRQVNRLQVTYRDYARGGFTRNELAALNSRIGTLQRQVAVQARDGNRMADAGRYDRRR